MGEIHVHEFMSLDGVIDAPTWTFDYGFDPKMGEAIGGVTARSRGILLGGPRRPRRLEHLVRRAPEQDAPAALRDGADGLAHLRVEAVVERPRGRVDHAVEAHELMYVDLSHVHTSVAMSSVGLRCHREVIGAALRGTQRTAVDL